MICDGDESRDGDSDADLERDEDRDLNADFNPEREDVEFNLDDSYLHLIATQIMLNFSYKLLSYIHEDVLPDSNPTVSCTISLP
jgi:hypothetical protein